MIPRHLVGTARHERDTRAEAYPKRVWQGNASPEDAQADYQAWCAIVAWLEGRPGREWSYCSFAEMALASGRCLQGLQKAADKNPLDLALAARRDLVAAIHDSLERMHEFLASLTAQLREDAKQRLAA